jgi:hypothetical protein
MNCLMMEQEHFVVYCSCRRAMKLFRLMLLLYRLVETVHFMTEQEKFIA